MVGEEADGCIWMSWHVDVVMYMSHKMGAKEWKLY